MQHIADRDILEKIGSRKEAFARKLIEWEKNNPPDLPWRSTNDAYTIMIAEMLLRKTRADAVSRIFPSFINQFPNARALAVTPLEQISAAIYSLGMISRGRDLKKAAAMIDTEFSGKLPKSPDELQKIFGKKRYTINALRCFAHDERVPIFDVNVARVVGRTFSIDFGREAHKNDYSWEIARFLLPPENVKEYNWALLDLGRTICVKKPFCEKCPLLSMCDYGRRRSNLIDGDFNSHL